MKIPTYEDDLLGPETTVPPTCRPPDPVDPHETAFRVWFRRGLAVSALALYGWFAGQTYLAWRAETAVLSPFLSPRVVGRTCGTIELSRLRGDGRPVYAYECVTRFSDGTVHKITGDSKL